MGKYVFVGFISALLLAMAPRPGQAQEANSIGIYTSAAAISSEISYPTPWASYNIYFVLHAPQTAGGVPLSAIQGFEYRVTITGPSTGFLRLSETLPPYSLGLGQTSNPRDATYIVAMAMPVPVTNRKVTLATWEVMRQYATSQYYLFLGPVGPASVPGKLGFVYMDAKGDGVLVAATGTQPLFTMPEFAFGAHLTPPVAAEAACFGSVKALFR